MTDACWGFLGVVVGAAIGFLGTWISQRSANKASLVQTKFAVYVNQQLMFYEQCLDWASQAKTNPSILLEEQFYLSLQVLAAKSEVFSPSDTCRAFESMLSWIDGLRKRYGACEEEIERKYFAWREIVPVDEGENPDFEWCFIGSDYELYEDEIRLCKERLVPERTVVDGKLKDLLVCIRRDISEEIRREN